MGAVVTKNIPPYAIVAGVPAKVIRYRFTENEIKKLIDIKWWDKPLNELQNNSHLFADINNLSKIEEKFR